MLLFYGDPGIVQNGSYVKIGKFGENGTVEYHDDLEGSLISTADKIVDLIYLKYLKAKITYEHDRRVETYPFTRNAIREAIYNAIAHNCYMYGTPIQIRIEEEQIIISNRCILPEGWTAETLMQPHDSIPFRDITGLPLYYLDMIWHLPDRTTITKDEFDQKLMDILKTDTWIIDGNYGRTIEIRLKYCDTVFFWIIHWRSALPEPKPVLGIKREEIPWVEEEHDEEFRQWIIDFPETKLLILDSRYCCATITGR